MAELILHDPDGLWPGEREVAELLEAQLPAEWVVVANLVVPDGQDAREIDIVVLGDAYIHVLEIKHHAGRIAVDGMGMRVSGHERGDPLRQVTRASQVLRTYLNGRIPAIKDCRYRPSPGQVRAGASKAPKPSSNSAPSLATATGTSTGGTT